MRAVQVHYFPFPPLPKRRIICWSLLTWNEIPSIMISRDCYNISVLLRLTPLRDKRRRQCVVFCKGTTLINPAVLLNYQVCLRWRKSHFLKKKNSSWKDSHRAQIAYLFKTEAPIQYCNKSWLQFWVKNPTVLAKQFMLRPDVTWNQSELFHFCMLTYIIGKKKLDVQNRNIFHQVALQK